jgi:hypothetical protein
MSTTDEQLSVIRGMSPLPAWADIYCGSAICGETLPHVLREDLSYDGRICYECPKCLTLKFNAPAGGWATR